MPGEWEKLELRFEEGIRRREGVERKREKDARQRACVRIGREGKEVLFEEPRRFWFHC